MKFNASVLLFVTNKKSNDLNFFCKQWFCKRDENGQMYFYEEGQGLLGVSELPAFDDVVGMSHKDKMRVSGTL